jgi:hypothetical protein
MKDIFFFVLTIIIAFALSCDQDEDVVKSQDRVAVQVGCWSPSYNGYGNNQIGCGLLQSFGNADLDRQFNEEVAIQRSFWSGFNPAVYLFNECGAKNALSFPQGYILFGMNMFYDIIYTTGSTLPNATVLAHEWAHQVQFGYGWSSNNEPTVKRSELEADAFAGYYTLLVKSWAMNHFNAVFANLYNSGDYQFNSPQHHGTPQERVSAGYLGMNTAIFALQNGITYTYADLHQIFKSQITKMLGEKIVVDDQYQDVIGYLEKIGNKIDEHGFHRVENLRGQNNYISIE